jgi:hypothetical protein
MKRPTHIAKAVRFADEHSCVDTTKDLDKNNNELGTFIETLLSVLQYLSGFKRDSLVQTPVGTERDFFNVCPLAK